MQTNSTSYDQLILSLQERRCQLESARVAAVEHLNCIRGGIAEIDFLIQSYQAATVEPALAEAETPEGR